MNELIKKNLEMVNAEVDNLLSTSPLLIRQYMTHLGKAKGKGIRASAVLASSITNENDIPLDAIHFASAIELLHLASLVHDDVMDDAKVRRGITTLNEKYGRKTAVICGDYVLALALKSFAKIEDGAKYSGFSLSTTMEDLALGELNQHINNGNLYISIPEYLAIIKGKTAALFEASFYAGAITSGVDNEEVEKYKPFGNNVGMIFQLMDDCLDYESSEAVALKPVASDFSQGVITLPLIHAFDEEPELRTTSLTREIVIDRVKKYSGVPFTKMKAQKYYDEAIAILETLNVSSMKKDQLQFILDKSMGKI
ncbi:hypothetical protein AOC36_02735 [Erysipelothrix larvae]|uniref:Heptaprenyl diphosphate synthase n=1 Tax=Erysipelothrix larvae TaxID=1514105 RepID=A0A109UGM8_9FIRM|nr:polyprenyl synthetase family protein [Erysipelothrix larvae]AMC92938.1 hypothetical protein AOC36_02735 [Erysipelothrix larvae]